MDSNPGDSKAVDIEEVGRLISALDRDLPKVKEGSADLAALRTEVEQLRAALHTADTPHAALNDALQGIRTLLQQAETELLGDALKGADYIARIGRMLGM